MLQGQIIPILYITSTGTRALFVTATEFRNTAFESFFLSLSPAASKKKQLFDSNGWTSRVDPHYISGNRKSVKQQQPFRQTDSGAMVPLKNYVEGFPKLMLLF